MLNDLKTKILNFKILFLKYDLNNYNVFKPQT